MKSLKQQLYESCQAHVEAKISSLTEAIREIQLSANNETKSSAGDKYETGRAMAQLEVERYQLQLSEAMKLREALAGIPVEEYSGSIRPGSLVFTSRGNFYIAINAGLLTVKDQTFFSVSPTSPIAQKLMESKVQKSFSLNNQEFTVLKIQ